MPKNKLTKKEFDRILPPQEKNEAIEQSVRYEKEYEESKQKLNDMLKKLEELLKKYEEN